MNESESKAAMFIDRFYNLLSSLQAVNADLSELAKESKDEGYEPALLRKVAAIRLKDNAFAEASKIATLQRYARCGGVQLELDMPAPEVPPDFGEEVIDKLTDRLEPGASIQINTGRRRGTKVSRAADGSLHVERTAQQAAE